MNAPTNLPDEEIMTHQSLDALVSCEPRFRLAHERTPAQCAIAVALFSLTGLKSV
jgi:hypothetical protein